MVAAGNRADHSGPLSTGSADPAALGISRPPPVQHFHAAGIDLELRGRSVRIDNRVITLGPTALALFKTLAACDAVVPRAELMRCLPEAPDDHALEVAMSRLRRSLGVPGLITTVVKRGYRLSF